MDSLRFGRALGKGARAAARGVYEAMEAATAPNPRPSPPSGQPPSQRQTQPQSAAEPLRQAVQAVAQGAAAYSEQKQVVTRQAGRLGKSLLAPFARAGRALWLEVTGSFYALFAALFLSYSWKWYNTLHLAPAAALRDKHLLGLLAVASVFAYFTVSSFVRAHRLQQRRA